MTMPKYLDAAISILVTRRHCYQVPEGQHSMTLANQHSERGSDDVAVAAVATCANKVKPWECGLAAGSCAGFRDF